MKEDIKIEKHVLVPKHTLLGEEEAKEVLERYNITFGQLPKISKKDPALSSLDVKPNDIIKIIRNSATAGKSVYYRVVIDD